jgi:hypothetical protein
VPYLRLLVVFSRGRPGSHSRPVNVVFGVDRVTLRHVFFRLHWSFLANYNITECFTLSPLIWGWYNRPPYDLVNTIIHFLSSTESNHVTIGISRTLLHIITCSLLNICIIHSAILERLRCCTKCKRKPVRFLPLKRFHIIKMCAGYLLLIGVQ